MSSKHHKHHRSSTKSETKAMSISRKIFSFLLFITIFILSVACCSKTVVLNQNEIASKLTDQEYVNALLEDVKQYSYDLCDQCAVPKSCVDDALTFTAINDINEAYIVGNLCDDERYTSSTYSDKIVEFQKILTKSVNAQLKAQNVKLNDNQVKIGVNNFSQKIVDYITKAVEIDYLSKVQTLTNVGKAGLIVLIVVSAVFALIFILAILSIGKKKYRCVRAISYSFIANGMLDFIAVLGVEIVKATKSLYIFPTYLCNAAMMYVEDSKNVFVGAGIASLIVAIILVVLAWKLKRDDK